MTTCASTLVERRQELAVQFAAFECPTSPASAGEKDPSRVFEANK